MTVSNWARQLNFRARRRFPEAADLPPLILITDRHRLPDPLAAAERLPKGAAVLLRDYDMPDRALLARQLARLCRRRGLRLLIAGDARLAVMVGANCVHYSEAVARHGRQIGQPGLITVACHDAAALQRAALRGANAGLLSPVFETASHPGARPLGVWRFAALVRRAPLPVYALGGVDARSARRLFGSGACGIAAISAFDTAHRGTFPVRSASVINCRHEQPA